MSSDILSRLISKRAADIEESISAEELFSSRDFYEYVQNFVAMLTYDAKITTSLRFLKGGDSVAYTDGRTITVNLNNDISSSYELIYNKFLALMGIVFHEVGHILFCDFNASKHAQDFIRQGLFFGAAPVADTPKKMRDLQELQSYMADPRYVRVFAKLYSELENCIIDPHDEGKMIRRFGAMIEDGINLAKDSLYMRTRPLEHMDATCKSPFQIIFSLYEIFPRYP